MRSILPAEVIVCLLFAAAELSAQQLPVSDLIAEGHIVPAASRNGIVINIPQRLLFHFEECALVGQYPIAVGIPNWRTPVGTFEVDEKRGNPIWYVPKSIQEEMRREGKEVKTRVAAGPANPLGQHWMGIGGTGCGIHGTNQRASISKYATHGCIRMFPEHAAELFARVVIGTPVVIVYEPVLLAKTADGRIYLEVHRDAYRKRGDPMEYIWTLAADFGEALDWDRVEQIVRERSGVARDVSTQEN